MIKEKIKQIIGSRGTILINHLLNKDFSYMSLRSKLFPDYSYSDLFIYGVNFFQNSFQAENSLAIFLKKPYLVDHKFNFYSEKGTKLEEFNYESSNYFDLIEFPKYKYNEKYLSFTHQVIPKEEKEVLTDNFGSKYLTSIQHRGYTIYKKKNDSLGSSAHGNFGMINENNKNLSAAIQSKEYFLYSPSYYFNNQSEYNLVFNNPTNKKLKIKCIFNQKYKNTSDNEILIEIMGNKYFKLNKYSGTLSFISKLPICRPVVFKNPDINSKNFDVFHS